MTYGLRPWEMRLLTRREWNAICDDWLTRQAEREEAPYGTL